MVIFLLLTVVPAVIAMIINAGANDRVGFHRASYATKLVMLAGLVYLVVGTLV
jgi:hypothetical protein